ncbi:MAG: O-antigen ligase family protein [Planctomycetaceae bacterium]|nr:O-antigen ligase family protein [Planctomycetaceae bacterium]
MSRGERSRSRPPAADASSGEPHRSVNGFAFACGVLFLVRLLLPAESADEGETVWVVVGWLSLATLTVWIALRQRRLALTWGWSEATVGVLVFGQVLSAITVLLTSGDKRAAMNMLWEWIGVLVAFVLLRHAFRDPTGRRQLVGLLVTSGVVLAGLGLWQRFIWYPEIQDAYQEWTDLSSTPPTAADAARSNRMLELQRQLGPEVLALQGASQAALKQRILSSQEPFGRFGLTNTFGGVLSAILVLMIGNWQQRNWRDRGLWTVGMLLVGITLLLTRSRTAWLAALAGTGYLLAARWSLATSSASFRTLLSRGVLALLALLLIAAVAVALGAVDLQDLSQAPKSVQYRIQYWTATRDVIRTHPWLGVGPGNFRQHYVQYKLPEASEEISDPHNLLLDVWATGGVLALLGLLAILWLASRIWRAGIATGDSDPSASAPRVPPLDPRPLIAGGILACTLVFLMAFLQGRIDTQLIWLGLAWIPAAWLTARLLSGAESTATIRRLAPAAAGLTLCVHLLTSGGIGMPVISLLLFTLLFVLSKADERTPVSGPRAPETSTFDTTSTPRRLGAGLLAACLGLLIGCVWLAFVPVLQSSLYISAGNAALLVDHRPERAVELFTHAVDADPLSAMAWRELSFAEGALWQRGGRSADRHFQAAVVAMQAAIDRDPLNPQLFRTLGELWLLRARRTGASSDALSAVNAFEQAVSRYPNSSILHAELARALAVAGRPAASAARTALALNDVNDAWMHYDKTFDEAQVQELQQLATP